MCIEREHHEIRVNHSSVNDLSTTFSLLVSLETTHSGIQHRNSLICALIVLSFGHSPLIVVDLGFIFRMGFGLWFLLHHLNK